MTRNKIEHEAAICLFHKDENSYLPEFIAYHLSIGFDHIFIIDNKSENSPEKTLPKHLLAKTTVDYFDHPKKKGKHGRAFSYFYDNFGHICKWVAFIDTDEFIVPRAVDDIKLLLADYADCATIGVNMLSFGDSGHTKRPVGLQVENFVRVARADFNMNQNVKCIVNMKFLDRPTENPHFFKYLNDMSAVNEYRKSIIGPFSKFSNDFIQINHYWSRSREEFLEKVRRGGGNGLERKIEMYDQYQRHANALEDRAIFRHIDKLRAFLAADGPAPRVAELASNPSVGAAASASHELSDADDAPRANIDAADALRKKAFNSAVAGDIKAALAHLAEGVQRFPDKFDKYGDPTFLKETVRLLLKERRWEEAKQLVSQGEVPAGAWCDVLFARAYSEAGFLEKAKACWSQVLERNPQHHEARLALKGFTPYTLEDKVREAIFDTLEEPVRFVQIGANDGATNDPLAKRVLKRGWHGILVEPVPDAFDRLTRNYSGIEGLVLENCAIDSEGGVRTIYVPGDGNTRLSSFSADQVRKHFPDRAVELLEVEVPVESLGDLLKRHKVTAFDVLCIDAEGFDHVVLKSFDLERYLPRIIMFEHRNLSAEARKDAIDHLKTHGYEIATFYLNTFAVPRGDQIFGLVRCAEAMFKICMRFA